MRLLRGCLTECVCPRLVCAGVAQGIHHAAAGRQRDAGGHRPGDGQPEEGPRGTAEGARVRPDVAVASAAIGLLRLPLLGWDTGVGRGSWWSEEWIGKPLQGPWTCRCGLGRGS
eukprot:364784-Chlamydomonas_euryale.AAC.5